MADLALESRLIRNPAFGAVLLYTFAREYVLNSPRGDAPALPLAYIALPIVLHPDLSKPIASTLMASGLLVAAEKFASDQVGRDVLVSIQQHAASTKELTTESISFAVRAGLLHLDLASATLIPNTSVALPKVNARVERFEKIAIKLGAWFASQTLHEISTVLQVAL